MFSVAKLTSFMAPMDQLAKFTHPSSKCRPEKTVFFEETNRKGLAQDRGLGLDLCIFWKHTIGGPLPTSSKWGEMGPLQVPSYPLFSAIYRGYNYNSTHNWYGPLY